MKRALPLKDITVTAIASAVLIAVQVSLSLIPNVELVTLLVILYTLYLGKKTLFVIYIFAVVQGFIYGFHIWWLTYLYVWTLLYFVVQAVKTGRSVLFWSAAAAVYGLFFGVLTSVPYFLTLGTIGGIAHILAGIPFDLVHCAGNFFTVLVLFPPLDAVFKKIFPP